MILLNQVFTKESVLYVTHRDSPEMSLQKRQKSRAEGVAEEDQGAIIARAGGDHLRAGPHVRFRAEILDDRWLLGGWRGVIDCLGAYEARNAEHERQIAWGSR